MYNSRSAIETEKERKRKGDYGVNRKVKEVRLVLSFHSLLSAFVVKI